MTPTFDVYIHRSSPARCLFCAWRIMHRLTSGEESPFLTKSIFFTLLYTAADTQALKHTHISFFIGPFKIWLSIEMRLNESTLRSHPHGDVFTR